MQVLDNFQGFEVSGFRPTVAPYPDHCSDVRALCANCAAEALRRGGFTGNSLVCNCDCQNCEAKHTCGNARDLNDVLPLPGSPVPENVDTCEYATPYYDQDVLPLPSAFHRGGCTSVRGHSRDQQDLLVPPTPNY